jgi:hypothetical protein
MSDDAIPWDAPTTTDTEYKKLEPGIHEFCIERFEKNRYDGTDPCNTAIFHVKVSGRMVKDMYFCRSSSIWKLNKTLEQLGHLDPSKSLLDNCEACVGVSGKCEVYIEESKKLDSTGNPYKNERISKYKAESAPQQPPQPPAETLDTDW